MEKPLGTPKKGAVARLRESYNKRRNQPPSPELTEALRKREKPVKDEPSKKIANTDRDAEIS